MLGRRLASNGEDHQGAMRKGRKHQGPKEASSSHGRVQAGRDLNHPSTQPRHKPSPSRKLRPPLQIKKGMFLTLILKLGILCVLSVKVEVIT